MAGQPRPPSQQDLRYVLKKVRELEAEVARLRSQVDALRTEGR